MPKTIRYYIYYPRLLYLFRESMYLYEVLSLAFEFGLDTQIPRELAYQMFISAPVSCSDVVMKLITLRDVSLKGFNFKEYRVGGTAEDIYFELTVLSSVPFLRNPSQSRVEALKKSVDEIGRFAEECKNQPPSDVLLCSNAASLHSVMSEILNRAVGGGGVKVSEAFMLGSLIRATIIARELGTNDMLHLFLAFSCTYRSPNKFVKRMVKIYGNKYYLYQPRLGDGRWIR